MRVLALDTTTAVCRAALVTDEDAVASLTGDPARPLAEQLPGRLLELLAAADLTPNDVDVFAVAAHLGTNDAEMPRQDRHPFVQPARAAHGRVDQDQRLSRLPRVAEIVHGVGQP